uniref:BHLH domain-containing protein n=1 Tax=Trichuris muris TaxID=70415 RepID=A0A5S6QG34_TRIMR
MKKETIIHSGQFMSSHVHEVKAEEEEEIDIVSDGVIEGAIKIVPDTRDDNPVTFYKFGPKTSQSIAIDTSLTKLNKCIQFVYQEGKLYTPKWKHFQGLNIAWKDRVRLNNVIWRAWFLQFVRGVPPKYCFFSIPEEDMLHKPHLPIVEGMFWKRRTETVASQYLRWRRFYTKRQTRQKMRREESQENLKRSYDDHDLLVLPYSIGTPSFSAFEDDDLSNWFTDTLFSNLGQPYLFPNPKEMAQAGNADIIQPGLVQLQPSLEEIMRTFDNVGSISYDTEQTMSNLPSCSKKSDQILMEDNAVDPSGYIEKGYSDDSMVMEYGAQSNGLDDPVVPVTISSPDYESQPVGGFPLVNEFCPLVTSRVTNSYCTSYVGPGVPSISGSMDAHGLQYSMAKTWACPREQICERYSCDQERQRQRCASSFYEAQQHPYSPFVTQSQHADMLHLSASLTCKTSQVERCDHTPCSSRTCRSKRRRSTPTKGRKTLAHNKDSDAIDVSLFSSQCESKVSFGVKREVACSAATVAHPVSSQYLPQGCIVRPIPISLSRSEPSAFMSFNSPSIPLSPLSNVNSPLQLSPPSTNLNVCSPTSSGLHISAQKATPVPLLQSNPLKRDAQLLILPPMASVPVPLLPFPGSSAISVCSSSLVSSIAADESTCPDLKKLDEVVLAGRKPNSKATSQRPVEPYKALIQAVGGGEQQSAGSSCESVADTESADSSIDRSERKRMQHLQAEQFRRCALKNGFDLLENMLFDGAMTTTAKPTNALILSKAAEEIRTLKKVCSSNDTVIETLKSEVERLNERMSAYQSNLDNSRDAARSCPFESMVRVYVKEKLHSNWKLWPLWQLMRPLYESYRSEVNGQTRAEVIASAREWLAGNVNHSAIRPALSNLLVRLATDSPLLGDPKCFQGWVEKMVSEMK